MKRPVDPGDFTNDHRRFVARLIAARTAAGLSQKALAERTQLSKTYISNVETLATNPSLLTILRLARGLGIEPGRLFGDTDPPEP